jgi:hypothetical protein
MRNHRPVDPRTGTRPRGPFLKDKQREFTPFQCAWLPISSNKPAQAGFTHLRQRNAGASNRRQQKHCLSHVRLRFLLRFSASRPRAETWRFKSGWRRVVPPSPIRYASKWRIVTAARDREQPIGWIESRSTDTTCSGRMANECDLRHPSPQSSVLYPMATCIPRGAVCCGEALAVKRIIHRLGIIYAYGQRQWRLGREIALAA